MKNKVKTPPHLDGSVVSNDGDYAVVQYADGEKRAFQRFQGQRELKVGEKVYQEAKPAESKEDFISNFGVGKRVWWDWRPSKYYGAGKVDRNNPSHLNLAANQMTVADLIRELQTQPQTAIVALSSDEEGNQYNSVHQVENAHKFEGNDDYCSLRNGTQVVILYPLERSPLERQ